VVVEESYERPLPTARVVPKDIGRVVVNLVNNAWYAVHAKARAVTPDFVPTIQVHTRRAGDRLEIRVRDNGTGVPAGVQGSLFQPFFTTKPPGQGTGLGLSISHEIVHSCGGTLAFETEEGSFTEFVVTLPAEALN
jgi:signal transduction histidine kinase